MVKCTKGQIRRLKAALRWKLPAEQRQRVQMVLLRESGMTQPLIAAAMGVSLSTVNRAHMAYDHGGLKARKSKASGGRKRENMTLTEERALLARLFRARTGAVAAIASSSTTRGALTAKRSWASCLTVEPSRLSTRVRPPAPGTPPAATICQSSAPTVNRRPPATGFCSP